MGLSRVLIIAGIALVALGVLVKIGVPIGRLPGDVVIRRGATTLYFPIVTCVVISLALSLLGLVLRR